MNDWEFDDNEENYLPLHVSEYPPEFLDIFRELETQLKKEFEREESKYEVIREIFQQMEIARDEYEVTEIHVRVDNAKIDELSLPKMSILHPWPLAYRLIFKNCKIGKIQIGLEIFEGVDFYNSVIDELHIHDEFPLESMLNGCKIQRFNIVPKGGNVLGFLFDKSSLGWVDFSNSNFRGFTVRDCTFGSLNFRESRFMYNFHAERCVFNGPPNFQGSDFPVDTMFHDCSFSRTYESLETSYRALRSKMKSIHNEVDEHRFASLEAECRYKRLSFSNHGFEKSLSLIYYFINSYGMSLWRPFILLGCQFFISSMLHGTILLFTGESQIVLNPNLGYLENWSKLEMALYSAFFGALGPLKVFGVFNQIVPASLFSSLLFWVESLLSSVLWFFGIMGVRRRFKL